MLQSVKEGLLLLVLLIFRSDNAQESRLGLKSDYGVKTVAVISSYIEHFFLLQLQSPNNILYSTFFSIFSLTGNFFLKFTLYFLSLHLHTMEGILTCGIFPQILPQSVGLHRNIFTFLSHDLKVLRLCKCGSCAFLQNFLQYNYP